MLCDNAIPMASREFHVHNVFALFLKWMNRYFTDLVFVSLPVQRLRQLDGVEMPSRIIGEIHSEKTKSQRVVVTAA